MTVVCFGSVSVAPHGKDSAMSVTSVFSWIRPETKLLIFPIIAMVLGTLGTGGMWFATVVAILAWGPLVFCIRANWIPGHRLAGTFIFSFPLMMTWALLLLCAT